MEVMPHPRTLSGARRWTLGVLLTLLLALCAALLPAHPAHAAAEGATLHALVNDARAANGQAPLARNAALDAVAAVWAEQLAAAGALAHNPDVAAQVPGGWVTVGENVAQGYPTEAAMHEGWMSSSGHRANILGDYTDVGIAFLTSSDSTWGVEVFAASPAASAAPAPAPEAPAEPAPAPAPERRAEASAEDAADESEPRPTATAAPLGSTRPATVYRSQARPQPETVAAVSDRGEEAFATWLWIGIPSTTGLAAVVGAVVLLRTRGLIGPPRGRHAA